MARFLPFRVSEVTKVANSRLLPKLGQHIGPARSFCLLSEMAIAKHVFGPLTRIFDKKQLQEIGEVKMEVEGVGVLYWTPSQHDALETYLMSVPHINGKLHVAKMEAEFDHDGQRIKVMTVENWKKYLSIPKGERSALRVKIPALPGAIGKAFQSLETFTGNITDELSDRLRKWCVRRFTSSSVTETEVEKCMKKLKDGGVDLKTNTSQGEGNIKEFVGVEEKGLDEVIKTLEDDNVPSQVISAIKRSKAMQKNSEGVCTHQFENGVLKTFYVLQILTLRKKVQDQDEYDMLIAWYELALGQPMTAGEGEGSSNQGGEAPQNLAPLSISQMDALRNYVETRAADHWKKKSLSLLEADKLDDDSE